MIIHDVDQNTEEWYKKRLGKISGSRWGKIYEQKAPLKEEIVKAIHAQGNEFNPKDTIPKLLPLLSEDSKYNLYKSGDKKREFWQTLSERLFTIPEEFEDPRERGLRMEEMSCERFEKETGIKTTEVGIIESSEHPGMIISPDRVIFTKKKIIKEAVEAKNYENAHHVEAVVMNRVPKDMWPQVIQYFIVIDTLEKLHIVFHSDNTPYEKLQYKCITVHRKDIEDKIAKHKELELFALRYMDEIVNEFAF